jgi:hypothetical protein
VKKFILPLLLVGVFAKTFSSSLIDLRIMKQRILGEFHRTETEATSPFADDKNIELQSEPSTVSIEARYPLIFF